jgi:hypothetical protein
MNDSELDRVLNTWQAPAPRPALRERVRAATVRERGIRFTRTLSNAPIRSRLRWLVAAGVVFAALTVAMGQSGDSSVGSRIAQALSEFWGNLTDAFQAHRVTALSNQIRESDLHVFIDGKPASALTFRHSTVFDLPVPGDGVYSITFWPKALSGWTRTGQIKETYIEFEAGTHHVVITCNRRLLISDSPVLVRRR